ncbi:DUF7111 family protein [Halocatena halophila]|uniref:DUF7111 family protein n=1 Tax=Halocatena halophila TaxID=2814576 RepID=UPI002ED5CDA7
MPTETITAQYESTPNEHRVTISHGEKRVTIAQNATGYAICSVRSGGNELERYYALDMALDHAAEYLGVDPRAIELPEQAQTLGI